MTACVCGIVTFSPRVRSTRVACAAPAAIVDAYADEL
jgi:hypothetical protein